MVYVGDGTADSKTLFLPENYQTAIQLDDADLSDSTYETVSHRYLWTPGQQDKLLADITSEGILWTLTDHLGTIRDVVKNTPSGLVVPAHIIYDAYGNVLSCKDANGTDIESPILFGFTGKYFDADTQLQNNVNRWYDSTTGRWLSTDPIGFNGNDTNLYRYVGNNITLKIDIDGKKIIQCKSAHPRIEEPPRYVSVPEDYDLEKNSPCRKFGFYIAVNPDPEIIKINKYCNNNKQCEQEIVEALNLINHFDITIIGFIHASVIYIGDYPIFYSSRDTCTEWCNDYQSRKFDKKYMFREICVENIALKYTGNWPCWDHHQVIKITIIASNHVIYLDNGWLGGKNHIIVDDLPLEYSEK